MAYHFNKPVIISNLKGLVDLVDHNHTGYIFKNKNVNELTEILSVCIKKYDKIEFINENIIKFKHQLSTKIFVDELIPFLNE